MRGTWFMSCARLEHACGLLALCLGCVAQPLDSAPLSGASACASCHSEHASELSRSAHGRSADSPLFTAMLPEVEGAWGPGARARCVSCHAREEVEDAVVSCALCHRAVGRRGGDGQVVLDGDLPVASSRDESSAPHATRTTGLLRAPELCGSCHELTGPELFVEPTLSEHLASPLSEVKACADCHLPEVEGDGEPRHRHDFVGVDPPWGADEVEATAAAADSLALWRSGLALRWVQDGDALRVEVENVGATHRIPTGATWLRDVWVELTLERADGVERRRVLPLGAALYRGDERVALITDADRVEERGLALHEVRGVELPTAALVEATATLRARAVREDITAALGRPDLTDEVPTLELATERYRPPR